MDDWHTKPRNRDVDDAPFGEEEREKEKEGEWKQKAKRREEKRERTRSKIRKEKKKEVESGQRVVKARTSNNLWTMESLK